MDDRTAEKLEIPGPPSEPEGPFVDLAWVPEEDRTGGSGLSRMLFPLRTGVELFIDPSMPTAIARAKQAAVLYDELVFETGLYEVSVAANGSYDWWTPQEFLTDERLAMSRRVQSPGTPFRLAIGAEGVGRVTELINSPLTVAYSSQYHTGILDELAAFAPNWAKILTLGNKPPLDTPEGKLFRKRARQDRFDEALLQEGPRGEGRSSRRWIINSFNRDTVVAPMVGATLNPTSLFTPMLEHRRILPMGDHRDGATALNITVPILGALPWEAILEFREHAGSAEARAMLRVFEEKAAYEESGDAQAFLMRVAQDICGAMAGAAQAQRGGWPRKLATAVLGTVVGLEPHIGPIGGPAVTAVDLGLDWMRGRRSSWLAALMVLQRRAL